MDGMSPEWERILAAKEARRHGLAALPIEEKVRILVQMQAMLAPILRARGIEVRVWELDEDELTDV